MSLIIVDIDGTVADLRVRFAKAPKPAHGTDKASKTAFQEWLDKTQSHKDVLEDKPVPLMRSTLEALKNAGHIVIYLTGRSESYRTVTEAWLKYHDFAEGPVYMRRDADWRKPAVYKAEVIETLKTIYDTDRFLAFDDDYDGDCAEMYRRLGGTHLKVTTCFEK